MLVISCMVPFGEDVVVPVTLRLSIITWVNADASESADKRLLQRAMPGRGLLHVVATKEHTVVERRWSGKDDARAFGGTHSVART